MEPSNSDSHSQGLVTRDAGTDGHHEEKLASGQTSTQAPEPIAIVGMACRLSGDVTSLEDFWGMICRGRNGWSEIPEDRFSTGAFWHPNPARKGAFNPRGGYFLKQDPALFDAPFFNITRAEAEAMGMSPRPLPKPSSWREGEI